MTIVRVKLALEILFLQIFASLH